MQQNIRILQIRSTPKRLFCKPFPHFISIWSQMSVRNPKYGTILRGVRHRLFPLRRPYKGDVRKMRLKVLLHKEAKSFSGRGRNIFLEVPVIILNYTPIFDFQTRHSTSVLAPFDSLQKGQAGR